jgi:hypothetical protein
MPPCRKDAGVVMCTGLSLPRGGARRPPWSGKVKKRLNQYGGTLQYYGICWEGKRVGIVNLFPVL